MSEQPGYWQHPEVAAREDAVMTLFNFVDDNARAMVARRGIPPDEAFNTAAQLMLDAFGLYVEVRGSEPFRDCYGIAGVMVSMAQAGLDRGVLLDLVRMAHTNRMLTNEAWHTLVIEMLAGYCRQMGISDLEIEFPVPLPEPDVED